MVNRRGLESQHQRSSHESAPLPLSPRPQASQSEAAVVVLTFRGGINKCRPPLAVPTCLPGQTTSRRQGTADVSHRFFTRKPRRREFRVGGGCEEERVSGRGGGGGDGGEKPCRGRVLYRFVLSSFLPTNQPCQACYTANWICGCWTLMAMVLRHQQVLGVNGHCVSAPAGDDGVDCEGFFFYLQLHYSDEIW